MSNVLIGFASISAHSYIDNGAKLAQEADNGRNETVYTLQLHLAQILLKDANIQVRIINQSYQRNLKL